MPVGPGKYDDLATAARNEADAAAVVLIVVNGTKGSGFSVQVEEGLQLSLSAMLRSIAAEIENSDEA